MARKFKREEIESHGIYEIRLHDIEDKSFIEKSVIWVFEDFSTGRFDYKDNDSLSPIESLEEEFIVYQRKIGDLLYPLTWQTSEEFEQIKLEYPQYRNKTDAPS